jgi:hypothetical protein
MTVPQNHRFHERSVYLGLKELFCARFGTAPPRAFREADPPLVTLHGPIPATLVFCPLWHLRVAKQRFSRSSLATPTMPETTSPACSPWPGQQHAWPVHSCSTACQAACSHARKTQLVPFFFLLVRVFFCSSTRSAHISLGTSTYGPPDLVNWTYCIDLGRKKKLIGEQSIPPLL